jgi:hypothetical protein
VQPEIDEALLDAATHCLREVSGEAPVAMMLDGGDLYCLDCYPISVAEAADSLGEDDLSMIEGCYHPVFADELDDWDDPTCCGCGETVEAAE